RAKPNTRRCEPPGPAGASRRGTAAGTPFLIPDWGGGGRMPATRVSMRKTREILRLRWGLQRSLRDTAASCALGSTTVHHVAARARAAGLRWPLPDDLDDAALEARLYPPPKGRDGRPLPDFIAVYRELKRRGVTLELLWQEYRQAHPECGYGYSRFCDLYRA